MHSIDKTKYSDMQESITNMSKNYGSYAKSQKQCCKYLHDHFLKNILDERIKAIFTDEGNPRETKNGSILCFVDYGAADTQNSLEIYEDIFQKVHSFNQLNVDNCGNNRKIHLKLGIQDLPANNWDLVKANITNNIASKFDNALHENLSFNSDIRKDEITEFKGPNLTINFCPSSFYDRETLCLQKDSVDIAFTSISTHWLSSNVIQKYDLNLSNSINANHKSTSPSELQQFIKASTEDGIDFLVARGRELRRGGKLLMCNAITIDFEEAQSLLYKISERSDHAKSGKTNERYSSYGAVFDDITCLVNEWNQRPGFDISFPMVPGFQKSQKEWEKCFANSEVVKSGLVLTRSETRILPNPYFTEIFENTSSITSERKDILKKNKEFADEYMKSIMAWGHNLFMKAFHGNTDLEFQFCEELKEKYFSVNPDRYKHDYVVFFCEATKN